jgi:triosephosphate isomerase (TIM)
VRKPLVAGNWKMNKTVGDAVETLEALKPLVRDVSGVEIVVCPPYTALQAAGEALAGSNIALGAQDVFTKPSGAYTGAISVPMILDVGCTWTIVGHSERRSVFRESDALLNEKLLAALEGGLKVMFCIGETLEEREAGEMENVLQRQVTNGLQGVKPDQTDALVIAYEPVWAIGTGVNAEPDQAEEAHAFVRGLLTEQFGQDRAGAIRILYGGSVKPSNAKELMAQPNIDGSLVGGASLEASDFAEIIAAG